MKQLFNDEKAKKNPMGEDTKYSRAIRIPQYEPKNEKPKLEEVYDLTKYSQLVAKINKSDVSDDEKKFLKFAASRHIVFTYSKIADYYAHASKEMQELMEQSALVILDIDDAIANGYVALSEKMQQLIDEEKERDAKAREAANVLKAQRELAEKKAREEKEAKKVANKKSLEDIIKPRKMSSWANLMMTQSLKKKL
mgnify:CR=1 FL=1